MIFNQMGVFSERVGVVKQTYAPPPSFLNSSYLPSPLPPAEKKILYETMVCVCVCVCVCVRIGLLQMRACLSVWSEVMREGHVHLKLVTHASWVN